MQSNSGNLGNILLDDLEDVSSLRPSPIWKHFWSSRTRDESKCRYCGKLFYRGVKCSTTNWKKHLARHHNIKIWNKTNFNIICRLSLIMKPKNLKISHTKGPREFGAIFGRAKSAMLPNAKCVANCLYSLKSMALQICVNIYKVPMIFGSENLK